MAHPELQRQTVHTILKVARKQAHQRVLERDVTENDIRLCEERMSALRQGLIVTETELWALKQNIASLEEMSGQLSTTPEGSTSMNPLNYIQSSDIESGISETASIPLEP